jgi:hypothetical protein
MAKGWPMGIKMAEMKELKAKYEGNALQEAVRALQAERGIDPTYTASDRKPANGDKPKAASIKSSPFVALFSASDDFREALLRLNAEFSVEDIGKLESARSLLQEISRDASLANDGVGAALAKLQKEAALIDDRNRLAEENEALKAELEAAKQALASTGHSEKVAELSSRKKPSAKQAQSVA